MDKEVKLAGMTIAVVVGLLGAFAWLFLIQAVLAIGVGLAYAAAFSIGYFWIGPRL